MPTAAAVFTVSCESLDPHVDCPDRQGSLIFEKGLSCHAGASSECIGSRRGLGGQSADTEGESSECPCMPLDARCVSARKLSAWLRGTTPHGSAVGPVIAAGRQAT
jgi:hypothetical protein